MKDFNIISFINIVKAHRKTYMWVMGIVFVLSAIILFSTPNYFTAKQTLAPELNNQGLQLGGLSKLSALAGFDMNSLGGNDLDAISTEMYPEVVNSTPFLRQLAKIQVETIDGEIKTTLYDYLDKYQKEPWFVAIMPKGNDNDKDKNKKTQRKGELFISKKEETILKSISNSIVVKNEKVSGLIFINVTLQDPYIATCVVDSVSKMIQEFIYNYRTKKVSQDLQYLERICENAKQEYIAASAKYSNFSDKNINLLLQEYKTKEAFLENEMSVKYQEYTQLAQQVTMARTKLQFRSPTFTIVQPSVVPNKKSGPKRMTSIILYEMITFIFVSLFYVFKEAYFLKN